MEKRDFEHKQHWAAWDTLAAQEVFADRYCSSPSWCLALMEAFSPHGRLVLYSNEDLSNLAVFNEREVEGGTLVMPADGMWLLGCPILGAQPEAFLAELLDFWKSPKDGLRQVCISGLYPSHPVLANPPWAKLPNWAIQPSGRMVASLAGGLDGFLGRRSKNFRSRLRRTVKKAELAEVTVEHFGQELTARGALEVYERIQALERESWKGMARSGIDSGDMKLFYEKMIPLLAEHSRFYGLFLKKGDTDVAYLFGARYANYFRGLQFSFLESERLGLGNVAQYHMISRLCEENCQSYDLGQAMEYKTRWAELEIGSTSQVFQL